MGIQSLDRVNVYSGASEMIDMGGNKKMDDHPVAEATWPPARVAGAVARRREKKEKTGRAGVVLLVCVITLPFLVLFLVVFFGGRGGAPAAWQSASKLAAICGGTLFNISFFRKKFAPQLQSRVQIILRNKNQEPIQHWQVLLKYSTFI
jgi:hypothetical protein